LNKNTRWALALVGAVIIIAAVIFISTSDEDTDATQTNTPTESTPTPGPAATEDTGSTGSGDTGGATPGGDNSGGATTGSGGAAPDDNGSGGAKPEDDGADTGGAKVSSEQGPLLVAGKVAKINVDQGDTVHVRAKSTTADELHIHGYDYSVDLPAGKTVSYKFKADIGGSFEMEFESKGLQVAALKVNP
jgi:hypothetical protein